MSDKVSDEADKAIKQTGDGSPTTGSPDSALLTPWQTIKLIGGSSAFLANTLWIPLYVNDRILEIANEWTNSHFGLTYSMSCWYLIVILVVAIIIVVVTSLIYLVIHPERRLR